MRKNWKKVVSMGLATMMCVSVSACGSAEETGSKDTTIGAEPTATAEGVAADAGIAEDSPYKGKGFDLSTPATVVMYVIGDQPEDQGMVMEKLNTEYLNPWLNTTLDVKFISWADVGTKYSLLLAGGEQVDLMYTSSWCNYNSETGKGAFKELTPEFLQTYMPFSYETQAPESWDQAMISGKIFAVPKNNAAFNTYNMMAVRKDILDKYNITDINSWDSMKSALYTIAENEAANGIYASGQRGNNEFSDHLWWQNVEAETLASGYDFMYYTHGTEDLPDWDKDVFYKYDSQACLDMYLEMAEMAKNGVWSANKANDASDARTNFVSGKTASLIWNSAITTAGQEMEDAGIGEYMVFDVTPNAKARRGSYADDMTAIPAASAQPERAALVLDCIKGFDEVNNLVVGGIEGVHYTLNEEGHRLLGPSAEKYSWGGWAWSLTGENSPQMHSDDEKSYIFGNICESKEFAPLTSGFTFDSAPVETEMALINSVAGEYTQSFNLGMFGDETEAKYQEFIGKLKDAGLDKVMEECKKQYMDYCARKAQ